MTDHWFESPLDPLPRQTTQPATSRPLRSIAIVSDAQSPQINGVVTTLHYLVRALRDMGLQVYVIGPSRFVSVPLPGYPEIRIALAPYQRLRRILNELQPDAIHIPVEGPLGWAARRYCLRRKLPFTTAYHSRFPEFVQARMPIPLSWSYALLKHFHAPSAAIMAPTPRVQRELAARGFARAVVWSRGVDVSRFCPTGSTLSMSTMAAAHAQMAIPPAVRKPFFLYVGRISAEKNLTAFLEAPLPGTKWVVGDGPERARLQRNFPDAVFWGAQPHDALPTWYRSADVFVFPSRTDTFGLVLLEAMACGLPVAAYPVAGPVDVLNLKPGYGVGALDEDLVAAANHALTIPRSQPAQYAAQFSWEAVALAFLGHVAKAAQRSAPTVQPAAPILAQPKPAVARGA
jgi:glycosyltransferase involved in cell wall biosynthesis